MRPSILACLSLLLATRALANDTAMGGQGANLVPLATSDVFMQSEDITLTLTGLKGDPAVASGAARNREKWEVEAHYVFTNPSERTVELQLGFPEYRCEARDEVDREFCPSDKLFRFEDMQTLVRGELVPQRKGKLDPKHAWAPLLGGVWLFDLKLGPGEQVPVIHRYRIPTTLDSSGGRSVPYVTRTGALWARPIERARFTFRYPPRVCTLFPPEGVPLASFRLVEEHGEQVGEASYEVKSWKPQKDLSFYAQPCIIPRDYFENDRQKLCPAHAELARFVYAGMGEEAERSDEPPPTREQVLATLRALSDDELRICKNYPFAAYGRPFSDDRLAQVFYGSATVKPSTAELRPFVASAHYTDKLLSPADWQWVKLVDEALTQRKQKPLPTETASQAAAPNAEPTTTPQAPGPKTATAPSSHSGSCSGCTLQDNSGRQTGALWLTAAILALLARRRRRRSDPAEIFTRMPGGPSGGSD